MKGEQKKVMFPVCLGGGWPPALGAHVALSTLDPNVGFHSALGMRDPLASYNISLGRVVSRASRYLDDLSACFSASSFLPEGGVATSATDQALESMELMLYAAAEHVDDIQNIAAGMFRTTKFAKLDSRYKTFVNRVDKVKAFSSTICNKMKHHQVSPRVCCVEVRHAGTLTELYGCYFEGVINGGVIGPHPSIHAKVKAFSATTVAWEVIVFLLQASAALKTFLDFFSKTENPPREVTGEPFGRLVAAACRLPTYTFDEAHPFSRAGVIIQGGDPADLSEVESGFYGAFVRRWSDSQDFQSLRYWSGSKGDGVSRTFSIVTPAKIGLVRWGR